MDYKKVGLGLGIIQHRAWADRGCGSRAPRRWLGVDGKTAKRVIALFGARELLAGGMLLRGPAVSTNVWNRVIGDGMDLAALGLAFTPERSQEGGRRRARFRSGRRRYWTCSRLAGWIGRPAVLSRQAI